MAYTTIDDPSEYFQTAIYNGNSSTLAVTSQGNATIAPDWIWIKRRSSTSTHALFDSTRGRAKSLGSEATDGEYNTADTAKDLISFDTDGFTVGPANQRNTNGASQTFVAWQWKVNGGTTTTNDASATGIGDIDSVIQANQTAGISIVTYTGTDTAGETFAHGLGAVPDMVIIKRRGADGDAWAVQLATTLGNTNALRLNESAVYGGGNGVGFWNDTSPTSTVMSLGDRAEVNSASTNTYMAYSFKSIQGYSKIGSYVGNGTGANSAADGTFVYTGFKPAWVMVKATTVAQGWNMFDNTRTPTNEMGAFLFADTADAETTGYDSMDFLSNGFKLRRNLNGTNDSGQTFIYMAFAERPFVTSEGVPTTAR